MTKRSAEWWREYRKRRRGRDAQPTQPPAIMPQPVPRPAPGRVLHMKSQDQIRGYIASAMRQYGMQPKALLHVLTGFISQLQDDMKRDTESVMAERACDGLHPGRMAEGVVCRMCHDAQMASKFGTSSLKAADIPGDDDVSDIPLAPLGEDR